MESAVALITELGFPIAAALGLGLFVWKLINRIIDGMETKLDTVDDKVGAAISMTYKSRKPIVFIGTGQNYPDLKRMHERTLINKLLQ